MEKTKIAQYTALGATVFSVTSFILGFKFQSSNFIQGLASLMIIIGILGAIVSYILGGGLGKALSIAGKILKWGWLLVPFPFNLVTGLGGFLYAIIAMVFLPIIPVRMACKER